MARITNPLTNTEVKQSKPRKKEYNLSDGDGLQLRIKPNGSKLWLLNYSRPFTKKRANLGFGKYPDVSLADARKLRTRAKELLAKDIDPKEYKDTLSRKQKERIESTLLNVASKWFEIKKTEVTANYGTDICVLLNYTYYLNLVNIPYLK